MNTANDILDIWNQLKLDHKLLKSGEEKVVSPIDGDVIANIKYNTKNDFHTAVLKSKKAYLDWRNVPAPKRGELVRLFGEELRTNKNALGRLVTLEVGKITSEGQGEVQEMIDVADFAVGLSRQLYGLTIASERPEHRMMEQWHPLGITAVITAFNFPVAVLAWNAMLALVCGNSVIWKPSEKAPLCAIAVLELFHRACMKYNDESTKDLLILLQGDKSIGTLLAKDNDIALVSATGSTKMGSEIAPVVASRFGKYLLELGGNNAVIVTPSADLDLATRAIVFGAVGTAGQRCTTTRRLIVHKDVCDELVKKLKNAYSSIKIGDPREEGVLLGPVIDNKAVESMKNALIKALDQDGTIVYGAKRIELPNKGHYVMPTIVKMKKQTEIVCKETFAPILYVIPYTDFDDAIEINNSVPQGLSSAIFTNDICEAEKFYSASGSDCGIANVNLGTSGAEIGGAFGGEKETGGGRESGSDSWKQYMRRATNTINRGKTLPLAQGINFEV